MMRRTVAALMLSVANYIGNAVSLRLKQTRARRSR